MLQGFFFVEDKKPGEGEDAPPVLHIEKNEERAFLAVFDGLGGSGAKKYKHTNQDGIEKESSGAYIASHQAARTVIRFIKEHGETPIRDDISSNIQNYLKDDFLDLPKIYTSGTSRLRSSLSRLFPTTMAMLAIEIIKAPKPSAKITSLWAGDSRCYVLDRNGLKALSVDDTKNEILEETHSSAISQDGIITNCICSDKDFKIKKIITKVDLPFIAIVASDGCYGYLPTPAHLELEILKTLSKATSLKDWREALKSELFKISSDDISMCLLLAGFESFPTCKDYFLQRKIQLDSDLKNINELSLKIEEIEAIKEEISCSIENLKKREKKTLNPYGSTIKNHIWKN